eukprot:4045760-Amphidinium_carterae.1
MGAVRFQDLQHSLSTKIEYHKSLSTKIEYHKVANFKRNRRRGEAETRQPEKQQPTRPPGVLEGDSGSPKRNPKGDITKWCRLSSRLSLRNKSTLLLGEQCHIVGTLLIGVYSMDQVILDWLLDVAKNGPDEATSPLIDLDNAPLVT